MEICVIDRSVVKKGRETARKHFDYFGRKERERERESEREERERERERE